MALPSTNITTTMVGNQLGISSRDVGALCTSSQVNYYSKYKPVSHHSNSGLTEQQLKDINYGYNIQRIDDCSDISKFNWSYLKPFGGTQSPYRIGDFKKYSHTSEPFFKSGYTENQKIEMGYNDSSLMIGVTKFNREPINDELGISDFYHGSILFKDLHLAFLGIAGNGSYFLAKAANAGDSVISIDGNALKAVAPISGNLILVTSDFLPPAYPGDTIPIAGAAFPIPHDNFYKDPTKTSSKITLAVGSKPYFTMDIRSISRYLTGPYDFFYLTTPTNRFTTSYGALFCECIAYTPWLLKLEDITLSANTNFHNGKPFEASGLSGKLKLYDKNFNEVPLYKDLYLQQGDKYYLGDIHILNENVDDIPVFRNIDVRLTLTCDGSSTQVDTIYMEAE